MSASIVHNLSKDMEDRRECQMKVVRNRIAKIAMVGFAFACVSIWLTVYASKTSRRRICQPNGSVPLDDMALSKDMELELNRLNRTTSSSYQQDKHTSHLSIAWLMSFPNSGTSYTMRMIARTTQTLVATNYQKRESSEERQLYPVFKDSSEGPFWPDPEESQFNLPPSYVLTKTHCGTRCYDCGPSMYLRDMKDFERVCSTGSKLETTSDGKEHIVTAEYNISKVQKAIHLIRNPFDNVVSRFHLERHRMIKTNKTDELSRFPNSRMGFRNFCQYMNDKWEEEVEAKWLTDEIGMMHNIPCRDDFFRYVVWHNLAFRTTDKILRIPTYILHYEDYSERFYETVTSLIDFLELEQATEPYPFHKGHSYDDYFTADERKAVWEAVKIISSNTTWLNVRHYFTNISFKSSDIS